MKKSYFIIISIFCFLTLVFINVKNSNAGVYFISKPDNTSPQDNKKPCILSGYRLTAKDCEAGKTLRNLCAGDSKYGKFCECESRFMYTKTNCTQNRSLLGSSCDGKYEKCMCDKNIYPYNTTNCDSPKNLSYNDYCVNSDNSRFYKTCSCDLEYSQTCSEAYEGVGTACNGKFKSCKCKPDFIKCESGKGDVGAKGCVDNEGQKFTSCKTQTCEAGGYLSSVPAEHTCTEIQYGNLNCYVNCTSSKKYKITDICKDISSTTWKVCRIEALRDIYGEVNGHIVDVKKGDLGGYVEIQNSSLWSIGDNGEYITVVENPRLSQDNNLSWVGDNAIVAGGFVTDDAQVFGNAQIFRGKIKEQSLVYDNAILSSDCPKDDYYFMHRRYSDEAEDRLEIHNTSKIYGNAKICSGFIYGNSRIYDHAVINGGYIHDSYLYENAKTFHTVELTFDKNPWAVYRFIHPSIHSSRIRKNAIITNALMYREQSYEYSASGQLISSKIATNIYSSTIEGTARICAFEGTLGRVNSGSYGCQKKYEITNNCIDISHPKNSRIVHLCQIKALTDFLSIRGEIRTGDLGGYIESEANLPQDRTRGSQPWISDGYVFDNALVNGGYVEDGAKVYGEVILQGAIISGPDTEVYGNDIVLEDIFSGKNEILK